MGAWYYFFNTPHASYFFFSFYGVCTSSQTKKYMNKVRVRVNGITHNFTKKDIPLVVWTVASSGRGRWVDSEGASCRDRLIVVQMSYRASGRDMRDVSNEAKMRVAKLAHTPVLGGGAGWGGTSKGGGGGHSGAAARCVRGFDERGEGN